MKNILAEARKYDKDMTAFLRDIIAIPSESCKEGAVIQRIKQEMEKVGFDKVEVDKQGNVLGWIGNRKKFVAMDAHIDTVGIGNPDQWKWDPYKGKLEDGKIYGRGAVDQKAGMASMVYAGKLIKEHNLLGDHGLLVTGTVQEEDCDGLCWQYIINEDKIRPACVVITEPTSLEVRRGHRGRMEIGVTTVGKAAHGSAPERGVNAVYKMAKIVNEIEKLNDRLTGEKFLGKGTVVVSYIDCKTPSLCAVPDKCFIHLDRRLALQDTKESAVAEVEDCIKRAGVDAEVTINTYSAPSYTGLVYKTECYFPTWLLKEDSPELKAGISAYKEAIQEEPVIGKWVFSTNGVATMGMHKIPTIGFGPGNEVTAHQVDEFVAIEDLVRAAAWYAAFPAQYDQAVKGK
ncbi:MAG TPA: YgeY family selenium metabolism-linked hydrolase [Kiritimatiellia bacterium]|nr:YgeY family selenium metabolism-linked hydrolase [Kiritimatiellia bacterium]